MASKNQPNELYLTREFDAPLKMVWEAWTDPSQASHWYGPRGHTIKTHSKDIRTGGHWSYTMYGPAGEEWQNKVLYLEVESYSRMVYDHGGNDDRPPLFRVVAEFSKLGERTKLDMTMVFSSKEVAEESRKFIKKAGGDSTWDRLAEYLSPTEKFVINRSFDAPIDVLYKMWTDPRHISEWTPPTGATMKFLKEEVRVGGTSFYKMDAAEGVTLYGKVHYLEMTKPNRIVYTQVFCDENGGISRHPFAPTWPETMLTTVTLSEEETGKTRVTVTWDPYGKTTQEELETFRSAKPGMTGGWTGSFDKLDKVLNSEAK